MCYFLDQLFLSLDKFLCLKELSVNLDDKRDVFLVIPEEFLNLHTMEKLLIRVLAEYSPSKLGKCGTLIYLFLYYLENLLGQ